MAKGKVWLTHSKTGVKKAKTQLEALGYQTFNSPLIDIIPPVQMPSVANKDALLIFTSQNGVRAFCELSDNRHHEVVTVGDATANLAREMGFISVLSAQGSSKEVTQTVLSEFKPRRVLHCAGKNIRGQIVRDLNAKGFQAEHHIYYEQQPVSRLPILPNDLTHIMFFSPMAAKTYQILSKDRPDLISIAISQVTDTALKSLAFKERRVATLPNLNAMLTALEA